MVNYKFPLALKEKILTTTLYLAETRAPIKNLKNEIRTSQMGMKRKTFGITWKEKVSNKIKEKTKLPDDSWQMAAAFEMLKTSKCNWARHVE